MRQLTRRAGAGPGRSRGWAGWRGRAGPGGGRGAGAAARAAGKQSLQELKQAMSAAVDAEDYAQAAALRDELKAREQDGASQVEEANRRFYEAFESRKLSEMRKVWGTGDHVRVIHPGSGAILGDAEVLKSWELIFSTSSSFSIDVEDVRVHVSDSMAFVTCTEQVDAGASVGRISATNVFELEGGEWKIVHHQGGAATTEL